MFKTVLFAVAMSLGAVSVCAEPIHIAAQAGDTDAVVRMISEGTPVDLPSTSDTSSPGIPPLFVAIQWGRTDVAKALMDAGADIYFTSSETFKDTPALIAVRYGRRDILELLLDRGVSVDSVTPSGSLLHNALKVRRQEIADLLIDRGAMPSIAAPSIEPLLAAADPDRGRRLFGECRGCHMGSEDKATGPRTNPNLWNIIGKDIASTPDKEYSDALRAFPGEWTYDNLNSFIANPGAFVPGTSMASFVPIESAELRADIIVYLRSLSDDPVPLP